MSSGKLGAASLAADTNTSVYTVPAGLVMTINILCCNRGPAPARVSLALVDGDASAPAEEDYIEYDTALPANGVMERAGLVVSAGETVVARSATSTVSVRVHGYEEA